MLEGFRAVADAIDAGIEPTLILLREDLPFDRFAAQWPRALVRRVTPKLFDELAETIHPQGVLAVVPIPSIAPIATEQPLTLVADGIRDPGNMGTLLRSAAAAGVDQVLFTPSTVDPFNPKAVRAGMGAHLRLSMAPVDHEQLRRLASKRDLIALADADGERDYDQLDWTQSTALIVGGEAFGPSSIGAAVATVRVRIPLGAGIESLNAGVAGSVVLFEAARQRRHGNGDQYPGDPSTDVTANE